MAEWQRDLPTSERPKSVKRRNAEHDAKWRDIREQQAEAAYWRKQPWTPEPR